MDNAQAVKKAIQVWCMLLLFCFFTLPCEAVEVTSPFGWRVHPISGQWRFHTGVDLGYPAGEPVAVMGAGKVAFAGPWSGYGNCVIVTHPNGDTTLYAHMDTIDVERGQIVVQYQTVGTVGSTGYSTGPHLHLEWWHDGQYQDPLGLFGLRTSSVSVNVTGNGKELAKEPETSVGFGFSNGLRPLGFEEAGERSKTLSDGEKDAWGNSIPKEAINDVRSQNKAPVGYAPDQLKQIKEEAKKEAVAEAKRQMEAEAKAAAEQIFFEVKG